MSLKIVSSIKNNDSKRKLNAYELRQKIGINTSISGKRLVDLAKEGR
jgi:ribosomal protein S25